MEVEGVEKDNDGVQKVQVDVVVRQEEQEKSGERP